MKHKSSRIIALTVLYILIIFGIFVIQFTIGRTFSYNINSMSVSGREEIDNTEKKIPLLPLHIVSNGLDFYITEQNPIIAKNKDNQEVTLKVLQYKKNDDTFSIICSNDIAIDFTAYSSETVETVRISVQMPEEFETVYFPWKLTHMARLERQDEQIFLRYGKNRFIFRGGYGFANTDDSSESPHLVLSNTKRIAFYETYVQSQSLDFNTIPRIHIASDEEYNKTKQSFREKALSHFSNAISLKNYNEDTLTAYIAERAVLGEYIKALTAAPSSALAKEKRTYKSSSFYGNLIQNEKSLSVHDRNNLSTVEVAIAKSEINVFHTESLIPFLINHSKSNLISSLEKIAININQENLRAFDALGILDVAMDYSLYFPNKQNIFIENIEKCETVLKNSLFSIDNGLYLSSDYKTIDTEKTLQAAAILIRYGSEYPEKQVWKSVGQALYSSILLLSGESASLPALFDIQGDRAKKLGLMANDSVILYAEKLYSIAIRDNSAYPHAESLSRKAAPGVWAWTSAKDINVLKNDAKVFSFRVSFIKDATHYLILRGIKPFYRIQIHGIDFRTDPRFEIYNSSGYVYDERSRTLFLKLRHKNDFEDITLFLGRPPEPLPLPVTNPGIDGPISIADEISGSGEQGNIGVDVKPGSSTLAPSSNVDIP